MTQAMLVLENGQVFHGLGIGATGIRVGEVVFNTALTGYQEILTDPSYAKQFITFTCPEIGNVGVNAFDNESSRVFAEGLIVRRASLQTSSWRSEKSLNQFLLEQNTVGISNVDTRALTHHLREKGAQRACLVSGVDLTKEQAQHKALAFGGLKGLNLAKEVTCQKPYTWGEGPWGIPVSSEFPYHVVVYDFGVKRSILRELVRIGARVTVVPMHTSAKEVLALKPDGVVLSNGPGDPEPCEDAIAAIAELLAARVPLFGICLGIQLLALACGARTLKMKLGHHGGNHPVQCLKTKKVMITSQNHGFAVDPDSLPPYLVPTHVSLFDGTLQGIEHTEAPAFAFQGHPEAGPGPNEAKALFRDFQRMMDR